MKYAKHLSLAAWLYCGTVRLTNAASSDDIQYDPSSSQMRYGDFLTTRSLSSSSSSSSTEDPTNDPYYWPTADVPGMNIWDIVSYEYNHNFELKPSRTHAKPSSSSASSEQPPSYLSPDLPASTATSNTPPNLSAPSPSTTPFPYSHTSFLSSTRCPSSLNTTTSSAEEEEADNPVLFPRKDDDTGIIHFDKNGYIGPMEAAHWLAECRSDYIGGWLVKRDGSAPTMIPVQRSLSPRDQLLRFLPLHPYQHLRQRAAKAASSPPPPLRPGMTDWFSGMPVYTDNALYETAQVSWWNDRTNGWNACGRTPPVFWGSTMPLPSKTYRTGLGTKKLKNANANVKMSKAPGGTLPLRNRDVVGAGDEDEEEWVGEVAVRTSGPGEQEREDEYVEREEGGEEQDLRRLTRRAFEGREPVNVEAGTVTRADAYSTGSKVKATPAPWTA